MMTFLKHGLTISITANHDKTTMLTSHVFIRLTTKELHRVVIIFIIWKSCRKLSLTFSCVLPLRSLNAGLK